MPVPSSANLPPITAVVYTESADPVDPAEEGLLEHKSSRPSVCIDPIPQALSPTESGGINDDEDIRYINLEDCEWDFFLNYQEFSTRTIQVLQKALPERFINANVWIDVEQDSTASGAAHGICFSRNVVSFLTAGSTESPHWQRDMRIAMKAHKNIILLGETDEQAGKPSIDLLIARCPEDLKPIFNDNVIIPYFADPDFMAVTFDKMARVLAEDTRTVQDTTSSRNKGHELRYAQHELDVDSIVMPKPFVFFAAAVGMGLPGSKRPIRRWATFVKWLIVLCMLLCTARFFLPEGPAFLDHLGVVQLVATHPLVLLMGISLQKCLRHQMMDELLENHINSPNDARRLHKRVTLLTVVACTLTLLLSIWGWVAYLPGFFSTYYFDAAQHSGGDHVGVIGVIGYVHGAVWVFSLPLVLGWFFTSLIIMFVLQELSFMALTTAYGELHPEIGHKGLETVAANPAAMNVKEIHIFHFEEKYLAAWELYRKIQWRMAPGHYLFWLFQVAFLAWSIWSLSQGFEALPASDEQVQRLRNHWNLVLRVAWFFGGSLWFGLASWLMGLVPFSAILYTWRMKTLTHRLFFTLPELRVPFQNFIADLDLHYRVLLIQASPIFFLPFVTILLANSVGFAADAVRLFRAL